MKRKDLFRFAFVLLVLVVAFSGNAIAQEKTPTGFYYPTGSRPSILDNSNWCGRYLSTGKNMSPSGCYRSPDSYHSGYDIPGTAGTTSVRLIADGIIISDSSGGWSCDEKDPDNHALLVKHRISTGLEFVAIYGHIAKNWIPYGVSNTVLPAGTIIGNVGNFWCGGSHLHFGIYVPSWHGGQTLPDYYKAATAADSKGYGIIGKNYYPQELGFANPFNFIEWYAFPGTIGNSSGVNPDEQAKQDMKGWMSRNTAFGGSPDDSTFGGDPNWDPSWELRWLGFRYWFWGNQYYVFAYHAKNKSSGARYIGYNDIYGQWHGWFPL